MPCGDLPLNAGTCSAAIYELMIREATRAACDLAECLRTGKEPTEETKRWCEKHAQEDKAREE